MFISLNNSLILLSQLWYTQMTGQGLSVYGNQILSPRNNDEVVIIIWDNAAVACTFPIWSCAHITSGYIGSIPGKREKKQSGSVPVHWAGRNQETRVFITTSPFIYFIHSGRSLNLAIFQYLPEKKNRVDNTCPT